jgi:hypothetical protein
LIAAKAPASFAGSHLTTVRTARRRPACSIFSVTNTIDDWITQDEQQLVANLRAAIRPGELLLAHDGGGNREATVDAVSQVVLERLAEGWNFTRPLDDSETGLPSGTRERTQSTVLSAI